MALALGTCASQAKTLCSISAENPTKNMAYDRNLFNGEITSPTAVIVKKDLSSSKVIQLEQIDTYEKWQEFNGDTLVTFNQEENDSYGITVGAIDISKSDTNILPLDAIVVGPATKQLPLGLVLPQKKLSMTCIQH